MQSEHAIRAMLNQIESDERLGYPSATIFENAPLALHQLAQETKINILKWVLE